MKKISFLLLSAFICYQAAAQVSSPQWNEVSEMKQSGINFTEQSLFTYIGELEPGMRETVSNGSLLMLNASRLSSMVEAAPSAVIIDIPFLDGVPLTLELIPNRVVTEDFIVTLSSLDGGITDYKPGLYFKGVIAGDPGSTVAISFFNNQVMGILNSTVHGTMELGALEQDAKGRYVLYRTADMRIPFVHHCDVLEPEELPFEINEHNESADPNKCVRIYFECEYDMYVANGSSITNTINYMTGVYNVIALLYSNDGIQTAISEIFVWNTPDSYATSSTSYALSSFRTNRPNFNGNVAHLVSRGAPSGGGVAWLNSLCGSYAYAYSYIYQNYSQFPTYSWTVNVITHEMGHNLGSSHTHDCVWDVSNNGNANEAIDGCGPAKGYSGGSCSTAPIPSNGGTIMSYCHLLSTGINFNHGFGPLPAARIQQRVYNATCLTPCNPCSIVISTSKTDVNCSGTSTGSINVTATGGTAPYNFAWSNNMTGNSINGLSAGSYTVTVTDNSSSCSKVETVVITQPAAISLTSSSIPESSPNACNGSIDLTVTGGSAPYTYLWSNSATSQDISNLCAGTYSVTVTDSKNCTATRTVSVAAPPCTTPVISVSSTNVSCNGGNNGTAGVTVSSGNAPFTYLWSNNATTASVSSLTAGTYSVTVTDAGNCDVSATITITQPPVIAFNFSVIPASQGSSNGSALLTLTGGTPQYNCTWCTQATGLSLVAYPTGNYTAYIIDDNACQAQQTVFIPEYSACNNTVNSFPYAESFESGFGLWEQCTADNFDWIRHSGSTPLKNTGPTSAANGTFYVYIKSESNSGVARLISPCIDLTGASNAQLTFAYSMYGNNMGTLSLDVSTNMGNTWNPIWSLSGNIGKAWYNQTIQLGSYLGNTILVRFSGLVGGMRSNMAIDNIQISTTPALPSMPTMVDDADNSWKWTSLYPNPAKDKMTLRFFADAESELPVYLTDALGRKFFLGNANINPGENNITFPITGYTAGVYYITAGSGEKQLTRMLLITP